MNRRDMYTALLAAIGSSDREIRDLIMEADKAGWRGAGRVIRLPGTIGDLYGTTVIIDERISQPQIEQTAEITQVITTRG